MRRSGAPSVRSFKKPKLEDQNWSKDVSDQNQHPSYPSTSYSAPKPLNQKIVYNIQWRDQSNKKHKTWKGNGILDIQLDKNRGVLTDHAGKYMGSTTNFKREELMEGLQMRIGNKEVELLDQIENQQQYWEARKLQVSNRGWGTEEWQPAEEQAKETKPKGGLCFVPKICLNPQPSKKPNRTSLDSNVNAIKIESNVSETRLNLSENLMKLLRPHQREGVSFMCECLMGLRGEHLGCILADEMGLGKTLQVLAAAHTLLRHEGTQPVRRVLIITPSSLIRNWDNEVHKWLSNERMFGFVVEGSSVNNRKKLSSYAKQLHTPFVISSYETLLSQLTDFQEINFDLLVCDEGHRLKNLETKTYKSLRELNIKRCILLTGTPIQNNLSEFFALAEFVNPGILGSATEFRQHFELPIERGQCPTATEEDKHIAKERSYELEKIYGKFMLRRTQEINLQYLPKKHDYICFVQPSKVQRVLLHKALDTYEQRKESNFEETTPFEMISTLRKICNHPHLLNRTNKKNPLTKFLARHLKNQFDFSDSAKLSLLRHLLTTATVEGREKIVLVSYHTSTLDILQKLCDDLALAWLRLDGVTPTNERNKIVLKFNANNSIEDKEALVLLLSAKAGGVGLNLVGATRLVLYDIDWNPANDAQVLSRIWRDGQQRDVHLYRFITAGCIEEKIFQRQVVKLNLGDFIMSNDINFNMDKTKNKKSMKFTPEELQELFFVQCDQSRCDTHQSLKCDCAGDGQNLATSTALSSKDTRQVNELKEWKHWKPVGTNETFMKFACVWNAIDELVYLFSSETN